jgi:hypothetical protein
METWNLLISKRIRPKRLSFNKLIMVGAEGFEPPTLCSQSRCATRLRYAPTVWFDCIANRFVAGWMAHQRRLANQAMRHTASARGMA